MKTRAHARESALILSIVCLVSVAAACGGGGPGGKSEAPASLSITSVEPASLPYRSGGTITIEGSGFTDEARVTIDGVEVEVTENKPRELTVEIPPRGIGGAVELVVSIDDTSSAWSDFRLHGISPETLRFIRTASAPQVFERLVPRATDTPTIVGLGPEGAVGYRLGKDLLLETFSAPMEDGPQDIFTICPHDLDRDGHEDLLVLAAAGRAGIWRGESDGSLTPPDAPEPIEPPDEMEPMEPPVEPEEPIGPEVTIRAASCLVDAEGLQVVWSARVDGRDVLSITAHDEVDPASIARGVFTTLTAPATGMIMARFDEDDLDDLVILFADLPPALWLQGEGARFGRAAIGATPTRDLGSVSAGVAFDLDGDKDLDLAWATDAGVGVWLNESGHFTDVTREVGGVGQDRVAGLIAADLDRDGRDDLIATTASRDLALSIGDGARFYDYSPSILPAGAASAVTSPLAIDLDGDADDEIVILRAGRPTLFKNWAPSLATDTDGDGMPDEIDVCPQDFDPEQRNRDAHPFLCEDATSCQSETGCELVEGPFGTAYLRCEEARTRGSANDFCATYQGRLLRIEHEAELAWLGERFKGKTWLDARDREEEGRFVHSDGVDAPLISWLENQPDDAGEGEDCVELISDSERLGWNDLPCSAERPFVCEAKILTDAPDPGDACDVCPGVYDPEQLDSDGDGIGDVCQPPAMEDGT